MKKKEDEEQFVVSARRAVSNHFYRQGLLCASHPRAALFFTFLIIFWACYPLLSIPIYSGRAQTYVEKTPSHFNTSEEPPRWRIIQSPQAYILQVIMKAAIHPYKKDDLIRADAFRAPLAAAFKLHVEEIADFSENESGADMDHACIRTDGLSLRYKNTAAASILPDYGCLIVSPANLWMRDAMIFQSDPNIISTVFNFQNSHQGHSSLTDLMFGMRQRETGMTKYPVRNRQRVITFAVTVALKEYNPEFIDRLQKHLQKLYPLNTGVYNDTAGNETAYIFFPPHHFYVEFLPFAVTLLVLFVYAYYSCSKIELIRSKLAVAFCAVVTVLGAVTMALGLSGVSLNIQSKVFYVPYLVAFISFENVLVVTKSVMSTPAHLDSKIRVAQGLRREGWTMLKNLFAEITVLSFGFFLGILDHSIQQFCLVAVMGLFSDFFLQTFFYTTILSMDIRQLELSDVLQKQPSPTRESKLFQLPVSGPGHSKSVSATQKSVVAPQCSTQRKESKRVRLMNYWARIRIIQRMFFICMALWISTFIYQTSVFEVIMKAHQDTVLVDPMDMSANGTKGSRDKSKPVLLSALNVTSSGDHNSGFGESTIKPSGLKRLLHPTLNAPWRHLPHTHWPMLFGLYNISLSGQYICILPPIRLSLALSPETAKRLRHPQEQEQAQLEKVDSGEDEGDDDELSEAPNNLSDEIDAAGAAMLTKFAPTSPGELFLALIFIFPSIIFILYLIVVSYQCLCSKNYAEWRASFSQEKKRQNYAHVIHESMPIPLEGHEHEIECLHSSENLIVSLCLGGKIYSWDSHSGQKLSEMDRTQNYLRKRGANLCENSPNKSPNKGDDSTSSDFVAKINTNFSSIKNVGNSSNSSEAFKFENFVVKNVSLRSKKSLSGSRLPSVWSLDSHDRFIVLACSDGSIEVWEMGSGEFQCSYDDGTGVGITHLRVVGSTEQRSQSLKIVAARITGQLEFLEAVFSNNPSTKRQYTRSASESHGEPLKCHVRNLSSSFDESWSLTSVSEIRLQQLVKAHSQTILCLDVRDGKVLTGSQDHTLRVLRLEDHIAIYTMHGHRSPVTSAFIDALDPSVAGSGSQNGVLSIWDLYTGACTYSIQGHDGAVLSMTYSPNYMVSMGGDSRLCVWERVQGHILNCINLHSGPYCQDLIMLTHNLLVTARRGYLVVWDVRLRDPVRLVKLGDSDVTQNVSMMRQVGDTIACSYGNQMRLVHFPLLTDKED